MRRRRKKSGWGIDPMIIKILTGLVVLVSLIWGGAWGFDNRYANREWTREQIGSLTGLYLESELRALRKELFDLQVEAQRRQLTPLEISRMAEVKREIKRLEIKIARTRDRGV